MPTSTPELSALDVATYLKKRGTYSAWVLQKLAYYCQAWSLAWTGKPLFSEDFEAWRDGPVCPVIRSGGRGDASKFNQEQKALIDAVYEFYAVQDEDWLIELTHREQPWLSARGDLPLGAKGNDLISKESIREYYSALRIPANGFNENFRIALNCQVLTPVAGDEIVDATDWVEWLRDGVKNNWSAA